MFRTESERIIDYDIFLHATTTAPKASSAYLLSNVLLSPAEGSYTVKKAFRYSRPQPGCHLPNSPYAGIMTSYIIIPAQGEFGK